MESVGKKSRINRHANTIISVGLVFLMWSDMDIYFLCNRYPEYGIFDFCISFQVAFKWTEWAHLRIGPSLSFNVLTIRTSCVCVCVFLALHTPFRELIHECIWSDAVCSSSSNFCEKKAISLKDNYQQQGTNLPTTNTIIIPMYR